MECPNCKVDMIKGVYTAGYWVEGDRDEKFRKGIFGKLVGLHAIDDTTRSLAGIKAIQNKKKSITSDFVYAWKCSKCGKVELKVA